MKSIKMIIDEEPIIFCRFDRTAKKPTIVVKHNDQEFSYSLDDFLPLVAQENYVIENIKPGALVCYQKKEII